MSDVENTHGVSQQGARASGGGLGKLANVAGAVTSLALLVGVGVWGYKLMVRDVSGIPVVRALDGPMRVQPENPGGRLADHQGLAVNAVAADGSAAAPADTLLLAPRPVDLADEDAPQSRIVRAPVRPAEQVAQAEPEADDTPPVSNAPLTQAEEIDALVAQITQDAASEPPTVAAPIIAPEPLVIETSAAASAPVPAIEQAVARDLPGVARSLRPQLRPASVTSRDSASLISPQDGEVEETQLDIDAASLPAGTRVVQLGAYETAQVARAEWDRMAAQFGDYLQGKQRIVQEASSGGRTFFRLRAYGFDDLSDARRFCSALVAEGADCIPVVTR